MRNTISFEGRPRCTPRRALAWAVLLVGAALSTACSSSPAWVPPDPGDFREVDAVSGNYSVTWKNLNPAGDPVVQTLVNETSEIGVKIKSGRATSSTIRVVSDEQMGSLVDKLREMSYFDHATPGVGLDNVPDVPNRRGIVAVDEDGDRSALIFTLHMGNTPVPTVYRDCKSVILRVHGAAQGGMEVRAGRGESVDADRLFKGPKIKMER